MTSVKRKATSMTAVVDILLRNMMLNNCDESLPTIIYQCFRRAQITYQSTTGTKLYKLLGMPEGCIKEFGIICILYRSGIVAEMEWGRIPCVQNPKEA
jgi:hypothetical protein